MKNKLAITAALSGLVFLTPFAVKATVVYSTIDPNATTFTFNDSSYNVFDHPPGSPAGTYWRWANQFSPGMNFTVTDISFGLRVLESPFGTTFGDMDAVVYANNPATNLPLTAAPLASSSALAPEFAPTVPLTTFSFVGKQVTLIAGLRYWVALEPAREGTDVAWGASEPTGRVAVDQTGTGFGVYTVLPAGSEINQLGAFRVSGVIPEPSTAGSIGAGLIPLLVRRKRTKDSATRPPAPAQGVPIPWSLLQCCLLTSNGA